MRLAGQEDIDRVERVLESGRMYLKERGLPQWQNGYGPNREMVEEDVQKQEGYVLTADGAVCGYAALVAGEDEYYARMDGSWDESRSAYVTIHRVAIDKAQRGRGLSKIFMNSLIQASKALGYYDIRIDTYPGNNIMIALIEKSGFIYRGMIQLPFPDGERRAYQLIVD